MNLIWNEIELPRDFARKAFLRGHRELQGFMAVVGDGELRVLLSMDPAGSRGQYLRHASASVGKPWAIGAFRRPTDKELAAVKARFMPGIESEEVPAENNQHTRHLWQSERPEAQR